MAVEMTQKELAELVGLTDRQIRNIDKEQPDDEKLCVKSDGGKYDAAIFVQRYVAFRVRKERESLEREDENDLDAVRARHEVQKIEKTKLEVARMRGELVDVADVRRLWGDIANSVMQGLIHLPNTIAPMVQGLTNVEVINSIIDKEIRRVLNGIADTPLPEYAAKEEGRIEDYEEV